MFSTQARVFLQQPLIARMSVIDSAGFPHTVPVWYTLDGDDVVLISERSTRKIGYLQINPKGALEVGGDGNEGYLMKGLFTVEEDTDHCWMRRLVDLYEPADRADQVFQEWLSLDIIVLRLKPCRVIKVA
jgi:nitroimidazol reductase NimA-like FMN-containing flavoprotein (pyridoxamine 5'-phosphate oxidase superfamily)